MIKNGPSPKRLKIKQKIIKTKPEKLLNKEVNRMQQKLEMLKEQLKKKKEEKEVQHNINSKTQNFLSQKGASLEVSRKKTKFEQLLETLKIDKFQEILEKYGITNQLQLNSLTQQKIDEMMNIPIGFRIKLKKYLQSQRQKEERKEEKKEEKKQDIPESNIEEILEKRKKQKKFIPLEKQINEQRDNDYEDFQEKTEEEQNQINVQSLITMLNINRSVEEKKNVKEEVQNQKKYCWMCLSPSVNSIQEHKRIFCSINCLVSYEQKIKVDDKIIEINEKYTKNNQEKGQEEQLEVIDLSIL